MALKIVVLPLFGLPQMATLTTALFLSVVVVSAMAVDRSIS
jgi:hypothetical protein